MRLVTKCFQPGANTDWSLTGAITHTSLDGQKTLCGEIIKGFGEGWLSSAADRVATCAKCIQAAQADLILRPDAGREIARFNEEVVAPFTDRGFEHLSTGGGCDGFHLADPQWYPQQKIITMRSSTREPMMARIVGPDSTGVIYANRSQLIDLRNRIDSILKAVVPPYILVTVETNIPQTLDEEITVGYYDVNDEQVWWVTLPNSHTLFNIVDVWKSSQLKLPELIEKMTKLMVRMD